MVTDQEFQELHGQVGSSYQHLGITFAPDAVSDEDVRIIQEIKNANLMSAIKIHQELHRMSLKESRLYVRELAQKLSRQ